MTYTDEQVAQYFIDNPGLNESQIAQVMSETGVSPEQVARVTGADPGYVSQQYDQYLDLVDKATVRPFSQRALPLLVNLLMCLRLLTCFRRLIMGLHLPFLTLPQKFKECRRSVLKQSV
jgi:hypothetical protein